MVRLLKTLCVLASLVAMTCACGGQKVPDDDSTLRVYVNRIQIPVMVLSRYGKPMRPIPESSFQVTITGFGTFRPVHVRLEGDDPLAIAVIIDASDAGETMWRDLPKAFAKLLPVLNPQDRLMLYGLDGCKAFRFLPENVPLNETLVHAGVDSAMAMRAASAKSHVDASCGKPITMADMLPYVVAQLAKFPGRRMIVPVGGGTGYAARLTDLKAMLSAESTVMLPVVHTPALAAASMGYVQGPAGPVSIVNSGFGSVFGNLAELAEYSGGRVRYLANHEFSASLAESVALARGRYILEFPRPDTLAAGHYRISVSDGHPRDFIRTSGISVPAATAEETAAARLAAAGDAAAAAPTSGTAAVPAVPDEEAHAAPAPVAAAAPASPVAEPVRAAALPSSPDLTDISGDLKPSH